VRSLNESDNQAVLLRDVKTLRKNVSESAEK